MSSGSESDEEFVPGAPEQLSEEGSADEETDLQYERELAQKSLKRKQAEESQGKKKRRTRNSVKEDLEPKEKSVEIEEKLDTEEEKKKEDDLWAKFLEGTDTKPKCSVKVDSNIPTETSKPIANKETDMKATPKTNDEADREKRIFEFADETIVVENNVIKERIKTSEIPAGSKLEIPSVRGRPGTARGGLSGVLGQLSKKNKLSTLEKSKLDWDTYKKEEGIEDEIQSHNKGKNGYLDRRDFLERADLRQYEIERDLRLSRRSNR